MAKQKFVQGSRVEYWRNAKNQINARIIGSNGETLASINQGFERLRSLMKNLTAIETCFLRGVENMEVIEVKPRRRKK